MSKNNDAKTCSWRGGDKTPGGNTEPMTPQAGRLDSLQKSTKSSFAATDRRLVVIAVDDDTLGSHTVQWYYETLHQPSNVVHVVHVPQYWTQLAPGMSAQDVVGVMQGVNQVTDRLRMVYTGLMEGMGMQGKFVSVGGNSRWAALVEYSRKQRAAMMVLTSRDLCPRLRSTDDVIAHVTPGSVTQDVLMHCQCPVLVARPPQSYTQGRC